MIWRAAPYLAAVAVAGAVWTHGYTTGRDRADARHEAARQAAQDRLMREADAMSIRAATIRAQEAALSARAQEAEDAARADYDVCRVPDPRSLRRLERRWNGLERP